MSYFFDGVDDKMETSGGHSSFQPTTAYTLMVWFKWPADIDSSWAPFTGLAGARRGSFTPAYQTMQGGTIRSLSNVSNINGTQTSTTTPGGLPSDIWLCNFHYWESGVTTGRRWRTYDENGDLLQFTGDGTPQTGEVDYLAGSNPFVVGLYSTSGFFHGRIAHVAIWHRRLTIEEMDALANGANPLDYDTGLGEYWPLVDNTDGIIAEQNLTNFGAVPDADSPPVGMGDAWVNPTQFTTSANSYDDETVVEGKWYRYRVRAEDGAETSEWTDWVYIQHTDSGTEPKHASGGSAAGVGVVAVGAGFSEQQEHHSGGSVASISVSVEGVGVKGSSEGSATDVGVEPIATGTKGATDSSVAETEVTTTGVGTKTASSGSATAIDVGVAGEGVKHVASASDTDVVVTPLGAGTKEEHTEGGGGSAASVSVAAVGIGVKSTSGGSDVAVGIDATGSGYKGTTGSSFTDVEIEALGSGSKEESTVASGGSSAVVSVSATGEGVKHAIGSGVATVGVEAEGDWQKDTAGGNVAVVQSTAVGMGFNPDASLSHRDITVDVLPVTFHTVVKEATPKTFVNGVQLSIPGIEVHEAQLRDLRFGSPVVEWVFKPVVIGTQLTIHEVQTQLFVHGVRL